MAMQILNSSAANLALVQLNKNSNASKKSLTKVSTGLRIISASDDTSAYAISERMQSQIRSLDQSSDNVEKGIDIINIAERAVDQQIQIVKKMREIAMKASDAACSQNDRDVLQSELSQLGDQLEDIAITTTYNGKQLLNGLTQQADAGAMRYFNFSAEGEPTPSTITGLFPDTPSLTSNNGMGVTGYGGSFSNGKYIAFLDFANAKNSKGNNITPEDLNGQGFSVACSTCPLFVSFIFDTGRSAAATEYIVEKDDNNKIVSEAYVVGIKDAVTFKDVYEDMFQGIAKANDNNKDITQADEGDITQVSEIHEVQIHKDESRYFITKSGSQYYEQMVIYSGIAASFDKEQAYVYYDVPWKELQIQGGTKASMYTNIRLPNTTIQQLFDSAEGSSINSSCVRTWEKAKNFVAETDGALTYLLDSATTLGAQARRLEFTNDNIVVSSENTQAANSTIRDADMAREMTEYTKNNVLMQAAQSMLAQANQNASGVLSLLQ